MGLFDFIQEDDGIGRAPHAFGELASLFIAHITRRRANQLRHGMLLHVFGHIEAHQGLFAAEEELRQAASYFGLANTRGAEEQEASDWAAGRFESAAAPTDRA